MNIKDRLEGCIIGGAIGDAWGSAYEHVTPTDNSRTYFLGVVPKPITNWQFTDDTQLTVITLEAISNTDKLTPEALADLFTDYFRRGIISGIGSSTLKAFQELQQGGHWSQVGRTGEYAAGNGAAMRIAAFAFWEKFSRADIRDFCRITHRNDEAYTGALAVITAIRQLLDRDRDGSTDLIGRIIPHLPDTRVRDRLIELNSTKVLSIKAAAEFGTSGYVVESIPFPIYCASQVSRLGMKQMFQEIIACGGDTDTNASIAGQIAGAFTGIHNIPTDLIHRLKELRGFDWIARTILKAKSILP